MINTESITVNVQSSIRIAGSSILYFDPLQIDDETKDADIVFVTHDHYDHFSAVDIGKVSGGGTRYVVPEKLVNELKKTGISDDRIRIVKPGEDYTITDQKGRDVKIHTVPAYNKLKPFHPKSSGWCGYVVELDDTVYYIAGDTDGLRENETITCDVALIPIGGTYTMNYKEAAIFVNSLKPGCVVPIHYGSFVGRKGDGEEFARLVDPNIPVILKL